MLNHAVKKQAIEDLERTDRQYKLSVETVQKSSVELFELRQYCSTVLIVDCEDFINTLANSPKEFEKSFDEYKAQVKEFKNVLEQIEQEVIDANLKAGGTAGAGIAAGAGVAAFAPTAAMAIATTFGTASTGTAIASLSGAAATKAALAWLGGGALAAGGGGMTGGSALLALAGPVGWGIGITALAGGGLLARKKNGEIARKVKAQEKEIRAHKAQLDVSATEIKRLIDLTKQHSQGMKHILSSLVNTAPSDYNRYTVEHKLSLGALINHTSSLSELLNKSVK
ncbi:MULTISPECIES: hypothetical protein [unclassified Pseudoalteromonas]|uniref:hypothetical protein n=1 Tax=unclassified Pseudoalteromonas TaxID=194690 RepID=UPI0015FFF9EA|nr:MULTISPECIES: hypothetical protein [unclassified Pseudoalteromonas]MBB1334701.1 hypothetical protein [Pseudoalteromonas sp. SR41-6]MBB1460154.1 hypothetical protein [Pseudoalteromonas sp. SG41-8]